MYKVIHNGKVVLTTGENMYDFTTAFAQGYASALGLKDSFINTRSSIILDKWSDGDNMVLVTKNGI